MSTIVTLVSDAEAPSSVALASGKIRLDYIDGLRAFALIMVMVYHSWLFSNCPWMHWWNILGNGYVGVNLFLTLSGFCLYWPFVKDVTRKQPTLKEFALRRAHRILPPYYFALLLFSSAAVLFHLTGQMWPDGPKGQGQTWQSIAWHFAMLQHLSIDYITTLDGPLWSLGLETNLYVAMPILVVIAQKYGIRAAVTFACVVTLGYRIWLNFYVGGAAAWESVGHQGAFNLCYFLPGRWVEFALGMWAAKLVSEGHADRNTKIPYGLLSGCCILLAFFLSHKFGIFNPISDGIDGLGFFFLILYASRHNPMVSKASFSTLLRHPAVVNLGIISYSVYLIHQPLLLLAIAVTHNHVKPNSLEFFVSVLIFVPLIVLISRVFFRFCEQPFINKSGEKRLPIEASPKPQEHPAA